MKNIRPITDLRKTNEISEACHHTNEPIYITKNGYNDLVIMSQEVYNNLNNKQKNIIHNYEQNNVHNMVKVGIASNDISIANCNKNVQSILNIIKEHKNDNLDILVFPELSITGYSCGDLFYQKSLIDSVYENIEFLLSETKKVDTLLFVGAPLIFNDKLYNCALCILKGEILGVIPKSFLPAYNEFYENRQFNEYKGENQTILINGKYYPFGTKLIFVNERQLNFKVACEICEDLWVVKNPSASHSLAGANVIVNLSASSEYPGKAQTRRELVCSTSSKQVCAYLYACSGSDESTQDVVFAGHNIICENGTILKESEIFKNEFISSEIDLDILTSLRQKHSSFIDNFDDGYRYIYYNKKSYEFNLTRKINPLPFIPNDKENLKHTIKTQAMGLVKRIKHVNVKNVILGLSGGLDSTLALIVCFEAFKILNYDTKGIHTITMPCFGTSKRTLNNAILLANLFNTTFKNISITASVTSHLKDLNHPLDKTDITFENAQARERTQLLFDYANQVNGIVIGTGDLSELALGWCTFNGDHMSNYCVNGSISKTLVKELVNYYANENPNLKEILKDILDTPISPELLPLNNGEIKQVTENVIGPYELHDFFLYYLMKYSMSSKKIFYLAKIAFKDKYNEETIRFYLKKFLSRFFSQQFKRSTLPDGIKASEISLSPRGDLRMPSDASASDFLDF